MKKILLVLGNYYPNKSSVSINMDPFIRELNNRGYHIDIITDSKTNTGVKIINDKKNTIFCIGSWINIFKNNNKKQGLIDVIGKSEYYFQEKILSKFISESRYLSWSKKKTIKQLKKLSNQNEYEFLISVSLPFKSNYILCKSKKYFLNTKWISWNFDPYSQNTQIKSNSILRFIRSKQEKKVNELSDFIFLTPELYDFYRDSIYFSYIDKIKIMKYATLKYRDSKETKDDNTMIKFLFTGRLYKDIRNPSIMIDIFSHIAYSKLSIMTDYADSKFLKEVASCKNIEIIPFGSIEESLSNQDDANFLVNIGNTVSHQVPGKIFELMGTGKPIIHFSPNEQDRCLLYLENYPYKYIVKQEEYDNNQEEIRRNLEVFINTFKGKKLNRSELKKHMKNYYSDKVLDDFINSLDKMR